MNRLFLIALALLVFGCSKESKSQSSPEDKKEILSNIGILSDSLETTASYMHQVEDEKFFRVLLDSLNSIETMLDTDSNANIANMQDSVDNIEMASGQYLDLVLKERAHDELLGYTQFWKAKVLANDIPENLNSTKVVCLLKGEAECIHEATINCVVADLERLEIQDVNDNYNSSVSRKALKTSVVWDSIEGVEQKIEFYTENLVL